MRDNFTMVAPHMREDDSERPISLGTAFLALLICAVVIAGACGWIAARAVN